MAPIRRSILLGLLIFAGGCSPLGLAKRGLTELRGASGKVVPVREAGAEFYRSIGTLEIRSVANTIGPVCPPGVVDLITSELRERADVVRSELAGSAVCTADVEITYHQPPGGVGALIGKGAILLGRARLLDERDELRADLLIGVFSRAVRTTEAEMAAAFGRALAKHVAGAAG